MTIAAHDVEDMYPLTALQQAMLEESLRDATTYVVQVCVELRGRLDADVLHEAWMQVTRRHTALRTTFMYDRVVDPLQLVYRSLPMDWTELDWRLVSEAGVEVAKREFLDADRARGFDLRRGPLMRAAIIRCRNRRTVLVWSHHHLVLDGWSSAIVLSEVLRLYAAATDGQPAGLSPARPFADYIAWAQRQDATAAERFWRGWLGGFDRLTHIAPALRAASLGSNGTGRETVRLTRQMTAALNARTRESGITLNTLAEAAWAMMLSRYCDETEVIFGGVTAGRPADLLGAGSIVGMLINTLPVRVRIDNAETVSAFTRRLQFEQVRCRAHEHVALAQLEAWTPLKGRAALLDHVLICENYPVERAPETNLGGLHVQRVWTEEVTGYPVTAVVSVRTGIELRLLYARNVFSADGARQLLAHWQRCLAATIDEPHRLVAELQLLSASEHTRFTVDWNRPLPSSSPKNVLSALRAHINERPDAVALVCGSNQLSYGGLHRRAQAVARELRRAGVCQEVPVGVCVGRGTDLIAAVIGVSMTGGTYVPIDQEWPHERVRFVAEDAGLKVIVTQRDLRSRLTGIDCRVVVLENITSESDRRDASIEPSVSDLHSAYVIYTSGSTGRPKGVVVTHGNLARLFETTQPRLQFSPDDVWALCHSEAFDFSVWELWGALVCGGRLIVLTNAERRTPTLVYRLLHQQGVTVLNQTPSAFRALSAVDAVEQHSLAVRLVIFGGEALSGDLVSPWQMRHPGVSMVNMYGITEATVHATWHWIHGDWPHDESPIGTRLPDTQLYALDHCQHPVPVGVPGELFIGGAGVVRGYVARPALTASRFIPDPFGAVPGQRLYRTGDRVRWTADGSLVFLGRLDAQLKIRGHRIEPGEIEAQLRRHDGIEDALVTATSDADGSCELVAYLVAQGAISVDDLRAHLRRRLPAYMIPATFIPVQRWPLTANGKIDRAALPSRAVERTTACGGSAPRTPTEELLCGIWESVLRLRPVGVDHDFFELGGHSLLATRVIQEVRRTFDVDLAHHVVYTATTIAGMARAVEGARQSSRETMPPLRRTSRNGAILPLSFAQERLWFLDQLDSGGHAYNIPVCVRLHGVLRPEVLARSLRLLVCRHEVLRTRVDLRNGRPVASIDSVWRGRLTRVDLSRLEPSSRVAAARRCTEQETNRAFRLSAGPLVRASLAHLDSNTHVFLLTLHHLVCDAWSVGVIAGELAAYYRAGLDDTAPDLPPLAVQYVDYAVWQRAWLRGAVLDEQLAYWRQRLANLPPMSLPSDRPPTTTRARGAQISVRLSHDLTLALQELGRIYRVTLFMTLLAAWQIVLSRHAGIDDIAVGTAAANRPLHELASLSGLFINTLVLRLDLSGTPTLGEVLRRVRTMCLEAYAHQDVPFEKLVEELKPTRVLGRNPLVQTLFTMRTNTPAVELVPDLTWEPLTATTGTAQLDLMFSLEGGTDGVTGTIEYDAGLFDADTIELLVRHWTRALESMAADPERSLTDVELLDSAERRNVLRAWNDTAFAVETTSVYDCISAQVAAVPDSVAVTDGFVHLTYSALDRSAGALSLRLRALGVGPEVRVGLCVMHPVEQLTGMLGILRSGGVYVPLDAVDLERANQVIAGADFRIVVSERRDAALLFTGRVRLVDLRECSDAASPAPVERVQLHRDNAACVLYNVGHMATTGVILTHGNVVNALQALQRVLGLNCQSRCAAAAAPNSSPSLIERLLPLAAGAAVVVRAGDIARSDAVDLRVGRATVYAVTPTTLRMQIDRRWPTCGQAVLCSGEELPVDLAARVVGGGAALFNFYGQSETTIWACASPIDGTASRVSLGHPIANVRSYVLDVRGEPAPVGVAGELYIGGAGVGRGYEERPGLTAAHFVPDPAGDRPGARCFRTGDVVRWAADGTLHYVGRKSTQVRIRGHAFWLAEIEQHLRSVPGVEDAVAAAHRHDEHSPQLVAYFVAARGLTLGNEMIVGHLQSRVAAQMIPRAFVQLSELPRTLRGTVDRRLLPVPVFDVTRPYVEPRTHTEGTLSRIWARVLELERVGANDLFFELGGHSLSAIEVMVEVNRQFGLQLPVRRLFETLTVGSLAEVIDRAVADDRSAGAGESAGVQVPAPH